MIVSVTRIEKDIVSMTVDECIRDGEGPCLHYKDRQ